MTLHTTKTKTEFYIWHGTKLIYKRWLNPDGSKRASRIFNEMWPDVDLPNLPVSTAKQPS